MRKIYLSKVLAVFLVLVALAITSFTVKAQYPGNGTFTKVSSISDLESGAYYVFYGKNSITVKDVTTVYTGALSNSLSSGRFASTTVAPNESNEIIDPSTSIVWRVFGNETDGFLIYNEASNMFCEIAKASSSGFALNTTSTHKYEVSVDAENFKFMSTSGVGKNYCVSIYSNDWRPYTSPKTLNLYKCSDTFAPTATFSPENNAAGVAPYVKPTITFGEAILNADGSEITDAKALINITPAVDFTAEISADKKVITITPAANLAGETEYTLSVGIVKDAAGNASDASSFKFTTRPTINNQNDITKFTVAGIEATLDATAHTVNAVIPFASSLTQDVAVELSDDATITVPAALTAIDFTNAVTFTVKAQNGDTQDWIATVTIEADPIAIKSIQEIGDGITPTTGDVFVVGVVSAIENYSPGNQKGFFVQDALGAWNGIYIFDKKAVNVGDKVAIKGLVNTYNELDQIKNLTENRVIESSVAVYPAVEGLSLADATNEKYEGVLVTLIGTAKTVIASGSWTLTDGTNDFIVDDALFAQEAVKVGYSYTITGVISQNKTNYILLPRSADDIIAKSNEADILTFAVSNNQGDAVIDAAAKTITAKVKNGTGLTALTAALTFSEKAIADKDLTLATDYTNPVEVKITAENGVEVKWTITITEAPLVSPENDITKFTITAIKSDAVINTTDHTVKATVDNGTALTDLTATIEVSEKATISPDPATVKDYSAAVTFTVKAEDGTEQPWIVTITEAAPAPKGGLFISEVSAGKIADVYHKYVEIYNATDATIDLGAQNYYIGVEFNDKTEIEKTFKLEGTIAPGAVFIVSENEQVAYGANYVVWGDFKINGDDRVYLLKDGELAANAVDCFGVKGVQAQSTDAWYYKYGYAVRNSNVIVPNSTFDVAEWTVKQVTEGITPGTHVVDGAEAPAFALTTSPANNATAVAIDAAVKVSFNRPINAPADLASLFTFKKGDVAVEFTATIDEAKKVITLTPKANMEYVTVYTVTIAAVTSDDAALTEATSISFTTDAELTLSTIKQIQEVAEGGDASPLKGKAAWVKGVVTFVASNANGVKGYYIQDAAEAWSGIYIYDNKHQDVAVGNLVSVKGMVDEFKNVTQISNLTDYQVVEASATLPEFITLKTNEIANEKYESILVKTSGTCTVAPDNYKNWKIKDASGVELSVDGYFYAYAGVVGEEYVISGFVNFFNNEFKISPRMESDVVAGKATAINDNNIKFSLYPNPTTGMFVVRTQAGAANYNVVIMNAIGKVVLTDNIADNSTKQFDLTNFGKGMYLVRLTDGIGVKTVRVVVK